MDRTTWLLIFAIIFTVIGFVLTAIFGEKALNKAYNPDSDHGLFWGGIVLLGLGVGCLILYIIINNRLLKEEIETLKNKIINR